MRLVAKLSRSQTISCERGVLESISNDQNKWKKSKVNFGLFIELNLLEMFWIFNYVLTIMVGSIPILKFWK